MSVGLPGSGIGGVFYLMSAMWMPVHSAQRSARGKSARLPVVLRQTGMAVLIIGMLWGTGFVLDLVLAGAQSPGGLRAAIGKDADSGVPHILRVATFAMTFGTLALVLLTVQVLRFVLPRRSAGTPVDKGETTRKAA